MYKKLYLTLTFLAVTVYGAFAQTGAIKATVLDDKTGETVPFASVVVLVKNVQVAAGQTDINGEVNLKPLNPGTYDVKAQILGYAPIQINKVTVNEGKTTYLDMKMAASVTVITQVEIKEYVEPLIEKGKTGTQVTRAEYQAMATKNTNAVVSQAAGVFQKDENSSVNVRGGRSDQDRDGNSTGESSTKVFIDGVRVVGSAGVPQQAVEQISVLTGFVPAEFGDATSGVVNITTRGPQNSYFGGIEGISSQPFDKFGYNFLGYSIGGPIAFKKQADDGSPRQAILGFIASGEFSTEKDDNPSALGNWKVKDDVLRNLERNPLRLSPFGGTFRNSEFITKNDLEPIAYRQNVRSNIIRFNAKLDFKPMENMNITVGGSIDYNRRHDYTREYALFNPSNNPEKINNTWRVYGRLTQKFGSQTKDDKNASNIKNAYIQIMGSYTRINNLTQDDTHRDNLFNYGYVGNFNSILGSSYTNKNFGGGIDKVTGLQGAILTSLNEARNVLFTPDTLTNPYAAAYTQQIYRFFSDRAPLGLYDNITNIQFNGGLANGDRPQNIYNLWYNTGRQYNGYSIQDNSQTRFTTSFNADIKRHQIQVGFEYEQRSEAYWGVNPIGLWTLARQLVNNHLTELDLSNPIVVRDANGYFQDTIRYNRLSNDSLYSGFARNFREKYNVDKKQWVNIDDVDKGALTLNMFSADNLLNNGNGYVTYYGFDPRTGERNNGRVEFNDFFQKNTATNEFDRKIGAFRPIYIAGYIQDKFEFRDLMFNIGVRVDRFDANQKVLKDPYSLYETKTAGEVTEIKGKAVTHPGNIGNDYVVYVDNLKDPGNGSILGYRDPATNRWYDKDGAELADPNRLAQLAGGKIAPFLRDPSINVRSTQFDPSKSFVDYKPQVNFMPRVSFSFPISDMANFYAHYDILTQRPPARLRLDPTDYFFIENSGQATINNPNLKPERTIDYEIGFQQVLGPDAQTANSSLTLSAFYREFRDMIQVVRFNQAYPITYQTYGNIDFGTVKGFTLSYDLRRTGNVSLNVNYTLQFADGTGSASTDAASLLNSGQPNLRTTNPLDFDQRHTLVANIDYRFASGGGYNGPVVKGKQIFANLGANLTVRYGSGLPFTKNKNVLREGDIGGAPGLSQIDGSLNGSRMPDNFRMDLRVEKSFKLNFGAKNSDNRKQATLNIYLQVLNLLNTQNVVEVYKATGNATDDGYLTALRYQAEIASQVNPASYTDLYGVKVADPRNFSLPRRTRLGVTLDF